MGGVKRDIEAVSGAEAAQQMAMHARGGERISSCRRPSSISAALNPSEIVTHGTSRYLINDYFNDSHSSDVIISFLVSHVGGLSGFTVGRTSP